MSVIVRLGQLAYINCLPIYHALEEGLLPIQAELVMHPPAILNNMLVNEQLDAGPISSIEYAKHDDKYIILPDLSISADGTVKSILLFSKVPVTELDGKKVCLTDSSATGAAMMKILFDHYFHAEVKYETAPPNLDSMLSKADAALLIGDPAMIAHHNVAKKGLPYQVTDLGKAWKDLTGMKMIYALWVARVAFARNYPAVVEYISKVLRNSKLIGQNQIPAIHAKARQRCKLPLSTIVEYYNILDYEFDQETRKALLTFFDYAYKSGLIDNRVKLKVWGEEYV
ncbi:MAG: menaquinone biosynthesis protein [Peptococcaceae bacterium]|nr:menaquinone biosynthesis protein [Peptococcaceae bacterium]